MKIIKVIAILLYCAFIGQALREGFPIMGAVGVTLGVGFFWIWWRDAR